MIMNVLRKAVSIMTAGILALGVSAYFNSVEVKAGSGDPSFDFSDVIKGSWYAGYVEKAAEIGLISVTNDKFEPEKEVTRAEFFQMIVNGMQWDEINEEEKEYSDVSKDSIYYDAIMIAKSAGVTSKLALVPQDANANVVPGMIFPDQPITREEISAVIGAVIAKQNIAMTMEFIVLSSVFNDYDSINDKFLNDIQIVYKLKIMQGMGGGSFAPKNTATKAQSAVVLIKLLDVLNLTLSQ